MTGTGVTTSKFAALAVLLLATVSVVLATGGVLPPVAVAGPPAPPATGGWPAGSMLAGQLLPGPATEPAAYQWPLPGPPPVTRRFEPPLQRWLPGHRGVDLAAAPGTVVYAAGTGMVFFAGPVAGRPVISIDHPDGLRTTYEPVTATVAVGDVVAAGDPIGLLDPGHHGCPQAACLHWGLRRGQVYLDPLSLLGLGRARLLPRSPSGR